MSYPKLPIRILCILTAGMGILLSQVPAEQEQPDFDYKALAKIRFWNMLPQGSPTLDLQLGQGENARKLFSGLRWCEYSEYGTVEPKNYKLRILNSETKDVVAELDCAADIDTYSTILVRDVSGKMEALILNDTYKFDEAASGQLMVFNFAKGFEGSVQPAGGSPMPLNYGTFVTLPGLPENGEVMILGKIADKGDFEAVLPFSFSQGKRQAYIILNDRYGRVRTRHVNQGYLTSVDATMPDEVEAR